MHADAAIHRGHLEHYRSGLDLVHGVFKADDEVIRWKQRYLLMKRQHILIYTQMSGVDMPQCLWKRTSIADVWVDMHTRGNVGEVP